MASLKPAKTQREPRRAWTRTAKRKVKKAFVRGVPDSRLRSFDMGFAKPKDCEIEMDLISSEHLQMRDNALESARVMANKVLEKNIGRDFYYFKVRVYPHQCIREHSMLTGAGADRLSSGMRRAFGRPIGRAAVVKKGQKIFTIYTMKQFEKHAKEALRRAAMKLSGSPKIVVKDITKKKPVKLMPGKKKKTKDMKK
jgi:large subunit ribosomal protein L10e